MDQIDTLRADIKAQLDGLYADLPHPEELYQRLTALVEKQPTRARALWICAECYTWLMTSCRNAALDASTEVTIRGFYAEQAVAARTRRDIFDRTAHMMLGALISKAEQPRGGTK